eukprot:GHUV01018973.1.p1 GENE.GHUV01018973.1~~GHUV01018973.1.p1  ORF type:complete len:699 (+),score=218.76 GHUV01018973.1:203-2299(+)
MARRTGSAKLTAVALQLSCLWLLAVNLQHVSAQSSNNAQGALLYSMGKWLTSDDTDKLAALGWVNGGNPCSNWTGVTCDDKGYVSTITLPNQGLSGSLPPESSIWGGLTGLTTVDLSGNSLGGSVPSQLAAAGTQLTSMNLSGNGNICGTAAAPATVTVNTDGTKIGTDCSAVASPAPANASSLAAGNDSSSAAAPTATEGETPKPVLVSATSGSPAPPPVPISDAPVCSCALKGFGSDECASALKGVCSGSGAPAVCTAGPSNTLADPSTDEASAEQLGQYLVDACFPGQDKQTDICTCAQNLLGTDCAKARVSLCVNKDTLCLPFQNIIDVNGSSNADAVSKIAPVLNDKCPVSEPTVPGVKATMEFPALSMGQYITKQYTQSVANALSAVTGVPSGSISTLDVRPFVGSSSTQGRRRTLLQSSVNGVQATYFLQTDDPVNVSQKLSTAAESGVLSRQLGQYGISSPASSLKVGMYVPSASTGAAQPSSKGFPLWALAPIIIGALLLLGLLAFLWFWFCFRRTKRAKEYAPDEKYTDQALPVAKSYEYSPTPVAAYPPVVDTPTKSVSVARPPTPEGDLPVSRSVKMTPPDQAVQEQWSPNTPSAAPASLPPLKTTTAAAGAAAAGATAASAWQSNVRPASGQLPAGAATSSMSGTKNAAQAERAKFWAQFQETWQQVKALTVLDCMWCCCFGVHP